MRIFKKATSNHLGNRITAFSVVFLICLLFSLNAYSAVPVVSNIRFQFIVADNVIRTWYDLSYSGTGNVGISIEASSDGGKNFNIMPYMVAGDIGNVSPGSDKKIGWFIGLEYPSLDPHSVIIRIIASNVDHTLRYIKLADTTMVLIPAGNFQMGSFDSPDGMPIYGDELPDHIVYVNSFYMDPNEVTNAQYAEFMNATGHTPPLYWADARFNAPQQPVVGVTWEDATAYCNWVGKRLPTEAEWERAARGGFGYEFPWGNTLNRDYGNFASIEGPDTWYDTSPVRSFLPNDYGLFDMIGNVYEWCMDYYHFSYYSVSPSNNPLAPEVLDEQVAETRSLRGGSCYDGFFPSYLRSATRYSYYPSTVNGIVGFRCVMNVPN